MEDESANSMVVEHMLNSMGYTISGTVRSGEAAIDHAFENKPDIILMDIRLETKMDGIEAASIIYRNMGIPVVFMTAYCDVDTISRAKTTHPYGYIVKPVNDRDIDIAIEFGLYRHEQDKHIRRLQENTIVVLENAIEKNDPYTAGHQKNVANLAEKIANALRLEKHIVDGIVYACHIHDIGKIGIPLNILSKPSKLDNIEFEFIKKHAQDGHDIVKNIEFPWPIAEIILQHHEHLDGSGYPQGLIGDEILLESRIVSVADVVEALVSHRPYRASKGIDFAIQEISTHTGIWYDKEVVDVCVSILQKNGISFNSEE